MCYAVKLECLVGSHGVSFKLRETGKASPWPWLRSVLGAWPRQSYAVGVWPWLLGGGWERCEQVPGMSEVYTLFPFL